MNCESTLSLVWTLVNLTLMQYLQYLRYEPTMALIWVLLNPYEKPFINTI